MPDRTNQTKVMSGNESRNLNKGTDTNARSQKMATSARSKESNGDVKDQSKKEELLLSDDRDEFLMKQRSVSAKVQARAPPSPSRDLFAEGMRETPERSIAANPGIIADTFDWLGERQYHPVENTKASAARGSASLKDVRREIKYRNSPASNQRSTARSSHPGSNDEASGSSFLLFTQSFDTISEGPDYLQDMNSHDNFGPILSPIQQQGLSKHNPATAGMEIALPDLNHDNDQLGSECSFADVSPIKVAPRQKAPPVSSVQAPAAPSSSYWQATPPLYPPRHIMQTNASHMGGAPPHPGYLHTPIHGRQEHDYHWRPQGYPATGDEHVSNPFFVIRSCHRAFLGYTYLLPCLRDHDMVTVNINRYGHIRQYQGKTEAMDANSLDLVIATRRIETAICLFGGNANKRKPSHASSIFRLKGQGSSSSHHYEQQLSQRYRLGEGRLSWEVEANPPISLGMDQSSNSRCSGTAISRGGTKNSPHLIADDTPNRKRPSDDLSSPTTSSASSENADAQKMKYRCKLCGQPKQNHNCTFRQSLQRSIGVQVFSAVNAYTAREPGSLAPDLSKMNNFVSYDNSGRASTQPPKEEQGYSTQQLQNHPSIVTPQSARDGGMDLHSPQSSLSTHSQELSPHGSRPNASGNRGAATPGYHVHFAPRQLLSGDRKRSHAQFMEGQARPFQQKHRAFCPSVSLRPEHYRAVTPCADTTASSRSGSGSGGSAYQYPSVSLTFAERKRLSDSLFCLCKEIPGMTADCAAILRGAREKNDWDQAVAELLAQVVVGLYCGEGDSQLDGLQQYLLTLGVSC